MTIDELDFLAADIRVPKCPKASERKRKEKKLVEYLGKASNAHAPPPPKVSSLQAAKTIRRVH